MKYLTDSLARKPGRLPILLLTLFMFAGLC